MGVMMHRCPGGSAPAFPRVIAVLAALLMPQPAPGGEPPDLLSQQQEILAAIEDSPFGEPLHVESEETERAVHGHIHAVVDKPFDRLAGRLGSVSDWCEILFLHHNIKACVQAGNGDDADLTLYIGRKRYQEPEDAERTDLRLHVHALEEDRLDIELAAERGPYGIRDFHMRIQAVPLDGGRSLLGFRYSVGYGAVARLAMRVYFAFGGRGRIGFTVERRDEDGEPVYIRGLRGMIERNSMRFYFALQTYLELPEVDDLEKRLTRWFDLTERHPEQLRELDRETYLLQKRRERDNQDQLQRERTG